MIASWRRVLRNASTYVSLSMDLWRCGRLQPNPFIRRGVFWCVGRMHFGSYVGLCRPKRRSAPCPTCNLAHKLIFAYVHTRHVYIAWSALPANNPGSLSDVCQPVPTRNAPMSFVRFLCSGVQAIHTSRDAVVYDTREIGRRRAEKRKSVKPCTDADSKSADCDAQPVATGNLQTKLTNLFGCFRERSDKVIYEYILERRNPVSAKISRRRRQVGDIELECLAPCVHIVHICAYSRIHAVCIYTAHFFVSACPPRAIKRSISFVLGDAI